MKNNIYEHYFKRITDLLVSLSALIILSPIFIILIILIKIKLGSPVIFSQKRPGLDGQIFTLYKFRTMTNKFDSVGKTLSDEKRLTSFGKKLRSTSLDELPELVNIILGDMSLIGPRPLLIEYLPLYNEQQRRRHSVKPGLSGLAQVNGRNAISWEQKFDFDIEYIDKITFLNDLNILLRTIKKVFIREGISSNTASTMEMFKGSSRKD